MRLSTLNLAFSAAAVLAAAGCATHTREVVYTPAAAPAPAPAAVAVAPSVIVADVAPPAPRNEVQPPAPSADEVWIPGYWNWSSDHYEWVAGHWEPTHAGYRWVPYHWDMVNGHWQLNGGWTAQ